MSKKSFEIQAVKPVYEGFFRTETVQFSHSLYQGGFTPIIDRELFCRNQAVVVLLYDAKAEQVALVEQCRVGALAEAKRLNTPEHAWLLEPVAGMIDPGETAMQAGIREVKEEAGVTVDELEFISEFYPSPGACDEILQLYAVEISIDDVVEFAGLEDEHEDIKIVKLSFAEAKQRIQNGQMNVATTMIALQWLFYQKLNS